MQVSEIMTSASISDSPSDPLKSAAAKMWQQQTGSLLVMDGESLVGIITERDVMKAVARGLDIETTPVSDVMTKDLLTISPTTSLHEAARHMATRWIRHLPVIDDGRLVGVVSQRDLVGIFASLAQDPEGATLPNEDLVRSKRLARIEQGDLD